MVAAIKPGLQDLAGTARRFLRPCAHQPRCGAPGQSVGAYKEGLPIRCAACAPASKRARLLDFHTAYELLYRFVDDLHNYAQTHASLADPRPRREHWDEPYAPQKTNWLACAASGIRASFILIVLGSCWVATAGPVAPP